MVDLLQNILLASLVTNLQSIIVHCLSICRIGSTIFAISITYRPLLVNLQIMPTKFPFLANFYDQSQQKKILTHSARVVNNSTTDKSKDGFLRNQFLAFQEGKEGREKYLEGRGPNSGTQARSPTGAAPTRRRCEAASRTASPRKLRVT